jgi:L-fuculokinase
MYPQYWAWRLCGVAASERTSLANHADLWRPIAGGPSSLVVARGWERLLPPVRGPGERLGTVTAEVAAATGLAPTTAVLCGIHDSNAALVPHLLARGAPFTVVSTGTWVVLMAVGAPVDRLEPGKDMLCNISALGDPVPAAKFMGGREFAALVGDACREADAADLEAVLASGALPLPAFVAQGGPFEGRPGRVLGELPPRPGARAALANLYAALVTDHLLTALGAEAGPVVVEGSFAQNPLYAGILAALRPGQPIEISTATAGAAFGAAAIARGVAEPIPSRPAAPLPVGPIAACRARWQAALGG